MKPPQKFYFCDRARGAVAFCVDAEAGQFPADRAAAVLAMHCFMRQVSPDQYMVLVEAPELHAQVGDLAGKAIRDAPAKGVRLTRREAQVLQGVLRGLTNKEIGCELALSERTAKFHVSALLAKYHAKGRVELVNRARDAGNISL